MPAPKSLTQRISEVNHLIGIKRNSQIPISVTVEKGETQLVVRCDCGSISKRTIRSWNKSTGFCRKCSEGKRNKRHGKRNTPEYRIWATMIQRCLNPKNSHYAAYGGRGIKVCDEWRSFISFASDMGNRPSSAHSIGRIDNDGPYCKANCRWETLSQQSVNRRDNIYLEYNGQSFTISQWGRILGVKASILAYRRRRGQNPFMGINVPAALTTFTAKHKL